MKLCRISSLAGYWLVALAGLTMGTIYTFADKIMPYHLEAVGSKWEDLTTGAQWMLLNFERATAAGFLTTSIALIFLLLFPLRKAETWAIVAAFVISIVEWGDITLRTMSVASNTAANPPVIGLVVLLSIITVSFILSLLSKRGINK